MSWIDTPRGLAIVTVLLAVPVAALAAWVGYGIAQAPSQVIGQRWSSGLY